MWRSTKLTIQEKNTQEKRSHGEGQEISGNTSENTEATMENIPALKTKRVWLKKPAWLGSSELQVCREPSAPGDHPAPRHTLCREREREVTQRKLKLKIRTITTWLFFSATLMTLCLLLPNVLMMHLCSWLMLGALRGRGCQCVSAWLFLWMSCDIAGEMVLVCVAASGIVQRRAQTPASARPEDGLLSKPPVEGV